MIKNISEDKIKENKHIFIDLLKSTERECVDSLINYLEDKTDFFIAPASTRYHGSFEGGLCAHSLSVYNYATKLAKVLFEESEIEIPEDSLKIVALLHDISKVNTYEISYSNKKEYSPNGSKWDENGKFDWVSVKGYKMIDNENRFIFVNHECASEFICRQFIPLRMAESVAIMLHHNGMSKDSIPGDMAAINYAKYPLALILHEADLLAAYTTM